MADLGVGGLWRDFNHDALQEPLALGDIVTLLPDGRNGLVVFSSICDGVDGDTVWIEVFGDDVTMPPNTADTRFRLVPKMPGSQEVGEEIDIGTRQPADMGWADESSNKYLSSWGMNEIAEIRQAEGKKLRFGDTVQIQHVVTGLYLSVLPEQALERGKKKVRLRKSSNSSLFILEPAFKTYSTGDQVYSGDQVMLRTVCKLNHHHMFLSMSRNSASTASARQLQLAPSQLQAAQELNATAEMPMGSSDACIWRPIISSSWQDQVEQQGHVKCEDIVCLYHKEGEKYLQFDPARAPDRPQLYPSTRVSEKERKKSLWLWKIESVVMNHSGNQIHCRGNMQYRIRHVMTERVLVLENGVLKMSESNHVAVGQQQAADSCFTVKHFDKVTKDIGVEYGSLIYLREANSKLWVTENTWLSRWMQDMYSERTGFSAEERESLQKQFVWSCKSAMRGRHSQFDWDVFLSYRVAADLNLVDLLYSKLTSMSLEIDGEERPLRVFWDKKCLHFAEAWEEEFMNAICSSRLVVPVLSRQTFAMEGQRYNITTLTADSNCDNVCLELELALLMKDRVGSSILPLVVGDLETQNNVGEVYTNFFSSFNPSVIPQVCVAKQHEKIRQVLAEKFGENGDDLVLRSVQEVFRQVFDLQAVNCSGSRLDAVEKSVLAIYDCISRLSNSQAAGGENMSVSYRDLPDVLAKFGFVINPLHLNKMLKDFDKDSDGRISLDEFEPMLIALKQYLMDARKSGKTDIFEQETVDGRSICSEIGMAFQSSGRPTRDAFWVMPVSSDMQTLVQLREKIKILKHFKETLEDAESSSLVAIFDDRQHVIVAVVRSLLLELTEDSELNVMSREGRPNKEMQKRLREAQTIDIAMGIISLPFDKGLKVDIVAHDKSYISLKDVICYLYRLMKQTVKGNETNSLNLLPFLETIEGHLGKGFACMQVLKELYFDKLEVIMKIQRPHIARMVALLNDAQDPRYVDYLQSLCTCHGKPINKIQEYISQELFDTMMSSYYPSRPPQSDNAITIPGEKATEILVKVCKICDFNETSGYLDISDPYVQVSLGRQSHRTAAKVDAGGSASFEEIFSFTKDNVTSTNLLRVVVYDSDSVKDDMLGELEIDLGKQHFSGNRQELESVASGTPFHVLNFEQQSQGTVFLAFADSSTDSVANTGTQALTSQHILPQIGILNGRLRMFLAGFHEPDSADFSCGFTEKEPWLDIARFKQKISTHTGKTRDLASAIMSKPFESLQPHEKKFRYFIRCLNLFCKLALGRNQAVLRILLTTDFLGLTYASILFVMRSNGLPLIVRSSFTKLMQHLFVDRHPQIEQPVIHYTRVWSRKLKEDVNSAANEGLALELTRTDSTEIPTAKQDELEKLVKFILSDLFNLANTSGRNEKGESIITAADITVGEVELMISQVDLCQDLLRFALLTKNRNSVHADFSNTKRLFDAVFRMIELSDPRTVNVMTPEGVLLMNLRAKALKIILFLCDLRANFRVSLAVHAFENIFDLMGEKKSQVFSKSIYRTNSSQSFRSESQSSLYSNPLSTEKINDIFVTYNDNIRELLCKCFSMSIVCPESIGADTACDFLEDNSLIKCLLGLCEYHDRVMTEESLSLIFRTGSQTARFIQDLSSVSLLVYDEGLRVLNQTNEAIRKLSGIQKGLNRDDAVSYVEAAAVISGLQPFLTVSDSRTADSVKSNQKIMFDLHLDQSCMNVLHLHLERKPASPKAPATLQGTGSEEERGSAAVKVESAEVFEPDVATNIPRRDLFQKVFDFLSLLASNNGRGQRKLESMIPLILGYVGIQDLNAVGCVRAIMEGNLQLCSRVGEDLISQLISANLKYGRRARWLNALEVFLECNGEVSGLEKNQDLILRLLLEDRHILLDFTCDYTDNGTNIRIPQAISANESRRAMNRIELMLDRDHLKPFRSWLKYHMTGLRLLGMCTVGKNQKNKDTCALIPEISLQKCIDNYLDVDLRSDGVREANLDLDVIYYVQRPYVRLINNVYLTSAEISAARLVKESDRWWPNEIAAAILMWCGGPPSSTVVPRHETVMGEFLRCLVILERRLGAIDQVPNTLVSLRDAYGSDLSLHLGLGCQILEVLASFFEDRDVFAKGEDAMRDDLVESLTVTMVSLSQQFCRYRLEDGVNLLVKLKKVLRQHGPWNIELEQELAPEVERRVSHSEEDAFLDNWKNFTARLALDLNINLNPAVRMLSFVRNLAPVFKSKKWTTLVDLTSYIDLDPDVLLTGMQVLTAISYLQPDNALLRSEWRDQQWQRFCNQRDPLSFKSNTSHGNPNASFATLQDEFAKGGAVEMVINCICNKDPSISAAGLRFGVVLLHLGRGQQSVQLEFRKLLKSPKYEPFFKQLSRILQRGKVFLRERGNPGLSKLGIEIEMMFLVFKMMRRLFIGQQRELQDMLRVQKLNRDSVNVLDECISSLGALIPFCSNVHIAKVVIKGFEMFAEAMSGGNFTNQHDLAAGGVLDLADRVFSTLELKTDNKENWTSKGLNQSLRRSGFSQLFGSELGSNRVAPLEREEAVSGFLQRNIHCSRVKHAVSRCVTAFLEGMYYQEDQSVVKQILMTLRLPVILSQLEDAHKQIVSGVESVIPSSLVMQEGLSCYIMLKTLQTFDRDGEHVTRVLSREGSRAAVRFFEQRVGSVEVMYGSRLERVIFPLPVSCLPGKPLTDESHWEPLLKAREWVNRDEKDFEFVRHLLRLVSKDQLLKALTDLHLEFTINFWPHIQAASSLSAYTLHLVIIFGGFTDNWIQERVDKEGLHQEDFSLAGTDMGPVVTTTVQYLLYLHIFVIVLRFSSFATGQCPLILAEHDRTLRKQEDTPLSNKDTDISVETTTHQSSAGTNQGAPDLAVLMGLVKSNADTVDVLREETKDLDGRSGQTQAKLLSKFIGVRRNLERVRGVLWLGIHARFWYEVALVGGIVTAMAFDTPMPTVVSLMDIFLWQFNRMFVDAVSNSGPQVAGMVAIGLMIVYVHLTVALWTLPEEIKLASCSNMYTCVMFVFHEAFAGGSFYDIFASRYASASNVEIDWSNGSLWRFFFEFSYMILFGQIMMAVIVVVLIHSMHELRFRKEAALHDLKMRCFVCDLTALRLEQDAGVDFETHTEKVHNPQIYLYFLIHLKGLEQSPADMTAVERFVADKVWAKTKNGCNVVNVEWLPDTTWMPQSTKDDQHLHIQDSGKKSFFQQFQLHSQPDAAVVSSNAYWENIEKGKEFLDKGLITQEEYDDLKAEWLKKLAQ